MGIKNVIKDTKNSVVKHSPEILTGMGLAGMVGGTVMAVKATPKAIDILENLDNDATYYDEAKAIGPVYLPSIVTMAVSMGLIVASDCIQYKRLASLTSLCAVGERAYKELTDAIDKLPEKKKIEVQEKAAQQQLDNNPVGNIFNTGHGEDLYFDPWSGRYFYCCETFLDTVINTVNNRLNHEGDVCLNDIYYELGLPECELGDMAGWKVERGLFNKRLTPGIATNGKPCLVLNYDLPPSMDYRCW